jgi:N-methylhydantoinase B
MSPPAKTAARDTAAPPTIDAVTSEVITSRLNVICDEGSEAAKAVSASPIVYAIGDVQTGIVLADGTPVVGSGGAGGLTFRYPVLATLERCSEDPGINPDDMFVMNDPFLGVTRHQPDIVILAPIHHDDKLVAWVGCHCHHLDTGAMSPGGWIPGATEVYQEGYRFPPVKLVERGELRSDIFGAIMNMVRSADKVALDYKGQIAANNVIRRKFRELCDRYGFDTVEAVLRENVRRSRAQINERISELPDATVTSDIYLETNDGVHREILRYAVTLTKAGEDLTIDFTGTSPQRMGPSNAALVNAEFWVIPPFLRFSLAPDVEYNIAFRDAFKLIAPEGTLVHPTSPAPVSAGVTIGGVAVQQALNKLMLCSDAHRDSGSGLWYTIASLMVMMGGVNQFGEPFTYSILDSDGHGTGASPDRDGVDTGGDLQATTGLYIANVEFHESNNPLLFRYRRQAIDSGGPGKFRGGVGLEESWTPHKTDRSLDVTLTSFSTEAPTTLGIGGGMPGALNRAFVARELEPDDYRTIPGGPTGERLPAAVSDLRLMTGDFLYTGNVGGGGYGDPLDRDPELVLRDVRNGVVSRASAESVYGVGLDAEGEIDAGATGSLRRAARERRLSAATSARTSTLSAGAKDEGTVVLRIGENVEVFELDGAPSPRIRCARCGHVYCAAHENHKEYAAMQEDPLNVAHEILLEVPELVLRRYYCPSCAVQFWVDLAKPDEPISFDLKLDRFHDGGGTPDAAAGTPLTHGE